MHEVHIQFHAFCWSLLGGINHAHLTGLDVPHLFPLSRVVLVADFIQEVWEDVLSADEVKKIGLAFWLCLSCINTFINYFVFGCVRVHACG